MKRALFKLKQISRQAVKEEPAGSLASDTSASPRELLQKEEFLWLSEIQSVLSPYWSARFDR
jgi:hypothetical protein